MVKILALALLACLVAAAVSPAEAWPRAVAAAVPAEGGLRVATDWQDPRALPRRFRNHCTIDAGSGRSYCSDHCGVDYQFYYCTRASFGCCRVGFGYCDWRGWLRCRP